MPGKQKITPFLWFDGNAEEAAKHYTSIFKNSKILSEARRVMEAMLQMKKLDISELEHAYAG